MRDLVHVFSVVVLVAASAALASAARAAVLLPDSFVVSMSMRVNGQTEPVLVLIDPGRRAPEVISSSTVGEGPVFSDFFADVEMGPDKKLYVSGRNRVIYRVDPLTGNRSIISDDSTGSGPPLASFAGEFSIDSTGTLYFPYGRRVLDDVYLVIMSLDPTTGNRKKVVDRQVGFGFSGWDRSQADLIDDSQLAVAMGNPAVGPRRIFVANLLTGEVTQSRGFYADPVSSLVASRRSKSVFLRLGNPTRIEELELDQVGFPRPRVILSCSDEFVPIDRVPGRLAVDDHDRLVFGTDGRMEGACARDEDTPANGTSGLLYRLDPQSGGVELLNASETMMPDVTFLHVVPVPSDYPVDDRDSDSVADVLDVCPEDFDPEQADLDGDGIGDACNGPIDRDGDDIADGLDLCPDTPDPSQGDLDGDAIGDLCDPFPLDDNHRAAEAEATLQAVRGDLRVCRATLLADEDGDGVHDLADRCPLTFAREAIDRTGCSLSQFCRSFSLGRFSGPATCVTADWREDEAGNARDCRLQRRECIPR